MKNIGLMRNTIQEYAWGSYTSIPDLLGADSPASRPQAELWMGAHPKAPSLVDCDGKWVSLLELIEKNPKDTLGVEVSRKFGNRLPYLFKVLAAAKPLSIQAHPSLTQAKEGFERENQQKIPFDAPNRNYKDDNHKPECICALTHFWALNGFRKISEMISLMEKICSKGLKQELDNLRKHQDSKGLKTFFKSMMTMENDRQKQIISDAIQQAHKFKDDDHAYKWMIDLYNEYPGDIGIFSPIILNLICLKPGRAMFLQAGELHAYLDGVGIELMANSDNVLRGGLTPKHVDVPELLSVLNFEERELNVLSAEDIDGCESEYTSRAEEFVLSLISVKEGLPCHSARNRSIEILLCIQGDATIIDLGKQIRIPLDKGKSVCVPAAVEAYSIVGHAIIYKASVPV